MMNYTPGLGVALSWRYEKQGGKISVALAAMLVYLRHKQWGWLCARSQ
jgi:hypothetical protein